MKKSLFLLAIMMAAMTGFAQKQLANKPVLPENFDAWNVQQQYDPQILEQIAKEDQGSAKFSKATGKKRQITQMKKEEAQTITLFAVGQSFHENYSFNYDGGTIYTYNVDLKIEGTKATFTNLFDLVANGSEWSPNEEYEVEGVYDENTKTITIQTSTVFDNATIVGKVMNYYTGVLSAGTVGADGKMAPAEQLVFKVEGDFDRVYTEQNFGVAEYTPDGSMSYGFWRVYRNFSMEKPHSTAKLVMFNNNIDFGEIFPTSKVSKNITIVNTGTDDADYAIGIEADDDAFSTTMATGTISGQTTATLSFDFACPQLGEKEGLATVEYDADGAQPLIIQLDGTIIPMPDYSPIVKNGDFEFATEIEFPFELITLDDGTPAAQSGMHGAYGNSKLDVKFNVPEGKLGTFTWKGFSNNSSQWYQAAGGYFVDNMSSAVATFNGPDTDISNSIQLAPGQHTVRFQYDGYYYTGLEANRLYVYDLELSTENLDANKAELLTEELNLGNYMVGDENKTTGTANIRLLNRGANDLMVTSATSSSSDFVVDINSVTSAATMNELTIPVIFNVSTAGKKTANITIETTAGNFSVTAKANVIDMPDYSAIVNEGVEYMSFTPNADNPFIVEGDKAYNLSSGEPDTEYRRSSFKIDFEIPEGKLGYMSWEGRLFAIPEIEGSYDHYYHEQGGVDMHDDPNMTSGTHVWYGNDIDASSSSLDELWSSYLACVPGHHSFEFIYQKDGDGVVPEGDRLEIKNIRLHIIDFEENNAELLNDDVTFEPTTVGPQRYTTATVTLKNIGSSQLEVTEIPQAGPFYGILPTEKIKFNNTADITLWFYPEEVGEFNEDLTIKTSAGDFIVHCHGTALSSDGILLNGDFEDDAYGWTVIDANNDGESWNLGTNLWGEVPRYVHSGIQCLASISYSNDLGSITPDNWTFSPAVAIPDDGAKLSYYIAGFHPDRYAEHYSLYIVEDISDIEAIKAQTPAVEETITEVASQDEEGNVLGWQYHEIDLADYAGKTIYLAYRHHDCTGQYIIRLDDVMIVDSSYDAIKDVNSMTEQDVERIEIFNASGIRVNNLSDGINIVRKHYADGSVKTIKIIK